jgi:hypothetical protein
MRILSINVVHALRIPMAFLLVLLRCGYCGSLFGPFSIRYQFHGRSCGPRGLAMDLHFGGASVLEFGHVTAMLTNV